MKTPVEYIKDVAKKLKLTVEFPNCFHIEAGYNRTLVFGYANGGLGYNLVDNKSGEVLESGELEKEVRLDYQVAFIQAAWIQEVCDKYYTEVGRLKRLILRLSIEDDIIERHAQIGIRPETYAQAIFIAELQHTGFTIESIDNIQYEEVNKNEFKVWLELEDDSVYYAMSLLYDSQTKNDWIIV